MIINTERKTLATAIAVVICTDSDLYLSLGGTTPQSQDRLIDHVTELVDGVLDGVVITPDPNPVAKTVIEEARLHMVTNAAAGVDWSGPNGCQCARCRAARGSEEGKAVWFRTARLHLIRKMLDSAKELPTGITSHGGDDEDDLEQARRTR